MKRRAGFTLVETLAAITVGSVMLAVAVGLLHSLFRLDRAARDGFQTSSTLTRLGEQFRADVHAATKIETRSPANPGRLCELALPEGVSVVYRTDSDGEELIRVERRGGKDVAIESFALPPESAASVERFTAEQTPLAGLRIGRRSAAPATEPDSRFRIEAAIGLDHRHEKQGEAP
jgi:prepilin-type N-terminal cleavage/methylation domain-containing protein